MGYALCAVGCGLKLWVKGCGPWAVGNWSPWAMHVQ